MSSSSTVKDGVQTANPHVQALELEIGELLGHTHLKYEGRPPSCWATNSHDLGVAITVLKASSASIGGGVTRMALLYKASPDEDASSSMVKEMGGFCQEMVSSLLLAKSVGACDALARFMSTKVRAVLHALKDVVHAISEGNLGGLNSLTGMVWEANESMQQVPKTNKLACRMEIMQWSMALKDTIDEFQGAAAESKAREGSLGEGAGVPLGLGSGDDDRGDPGYTLEEAGCVEAVTRLLAMGRRCLKAGNDWLNAIEGPNPDPSPSPSPSPDPDPGPSPDPLSSCSVEGLQGSGGKEGGTAGASSEVVLGDGGAGVSLAQAQAIQSSLEAMFEASEDLGMAL
ncbi:unnamed protein product, partial [Discosporangium mesarthrocarpum]